MLNFICKWVWDFIQYANNEKIKARGNIFLLLWKMKNKKSFEKKKTYRSKNYYFYSNSINLVHKPNL
jgi:hypothetical protein